MKDIATFSNPPVVETVLSVSFAPVEKLVSAMLGDYWREIRDAFPTAAEHPPYDMPFERLDVVSRGVPLSIEVGPPPAKTRLWLVSKDDQHLIQLQRDWFALNWRKKAGDYPRYESGRNDFRRFYERFERFLSRFDLGPLGPTQCEVTYINHISSEEVGPEGAASVLAFLNVPAMREPVDRLEMSQVALSFLMANDGNPIGRLHVSMVEQLVRGEPMWVLNLTARGAPLGEGIEGVLRFFDLGRQAIVTNFQSFTTAEMHKQWGMQ